MNPLRTARRIVEAQARTLDLDGRVVLVTGAGDGIGREVARQVVARGARVVVVDRDGRTAQRAADELGRDAALGVCADVTDAAAMRAAVGASLDRFGRLDVVVANAGITPPATPLRTLDPADFARVMDVNVCGIHNTVQPAIEALIGARGHVVVVASCAAFSPPVAGGTYMASKAAAEMISRAYRIELARHGVTATTSYFGVVDTAMARATLEDDPLGEELGAMLKGPLGTQITPQEAAATIVHAIEHRSARSLAPTAWAPLGVLRGLVAPVGDAVLSVDPRVHDLLRDAEVRSRSAVAP